MFYHLSADEVAAMAGPMGTTIVRLLNDSEQNTSPLIPPVQSSSGAESCLSKLQHNEGPIKKKRIETSWIVLRQTRPQQLVNLVRTLFEQAEYASTNKVQTMQKSRYHDSVIVDHQKCISELDQADV